MSNAHIGLPLPEHAAAYFNHYLKLATQHTDLLLALEENKTEMCAVIDSIAEEKKDYTYETGKWTINGVLLHIIDTERIFQYRALRIGRNDSTTLVGFEQDDYDSFAFGSTRSLASIKEEFLAVRNSTIALFKNFLPENFDFIGNASGNPLTARSAGWILIGHAKHHANILQERYA